MTTALDSAQEEAFLDSFLGMIRAADGDFQALIPLAAASLDSGSLELIYQHLMRSPRSKNAIAQRLVNAPFDFEALAQLPENSLGFKYCQHMQLNHLKPITHKAFENNYDYMNFHLSETHDIWHVITGSSTDVLGELQLEAFYVAQLKYSRFWLALLAKNLAKAMVYDIEASTAYMERVIHGWHMGCEAESLFGVPWNTLWEKPLVEVRQSLKVNVS